MDGSNEARVIPESPPLVSIIIPVFNQGDELRECLRAIEGQTYDHERFEVIAVDNGSSRPIDEVVAPFRFARCLREPKPGSYAARNRGIPASRGEILGFTDADCVPAADWIARGVDAVLRLGGDGMVGGSIELTVRDPRKPTAAELYDSVCGFPQESFIRWGFSVTANLFTTRSTIDSVGPFDERLMSSGDLEWGQRVRARGLPQVYAADVRIAHPARRTLGELIRKIVRVAGGNQQLADQRSQGTEGLLEYTWQQLIQLKRIRANIYHDRLNTYVAKLKFAAVVWSVDFVRTIERFRVHYGGRPRRT
jgi:glycosyltransferase involved in cell wall biosynthesis